jgi:serine/threonine protein kinase
MGADETAAWSLSSANTSPLGSMRSLFGFDLDDDTWLSRLRGLSQPEAPPQLGRIGPYELISIIGRGGQGIIYKVRQPGTGRAIALKRLSAGAFATPEMRARFRREVEAAAALDHPNIVTVYGSEVIDDQLVLAMQWIDGAPFDRWACPPVEPRLSPREVLQVFAKVCDAIQHAHQRGVIHRDIKPSNILIDRVCVPHVLDFGLAKLDADSGSEPLLTQTGAFVGTPAYAAPEAFHRRIGDLDARSDVYSLGALLYQALTGARHRLLAGEDQGEFPAMHAGTEHHVPRAPSKLDGRLDFEIDAIVLKALAGKPSDRYATVDALASDVRRYLTREAVLAHPPSATYRMRKFAARPPPWRSLSQHC